MLRRDWEEQEPREGDHLGGCGTCRRELMTAWTSVGVLEVATSSAYFEVSQSDLLIG